MLANGPALNGVQSGFPRSNPDRFLNIRDENLSVADAACLSGATDRLDSFFDQIVTQHNLDLHFG